MHQRRVMFWGNAKQERGTENDQADSPALRQFIVALASSRTLCLLAVGAFADDNLKPPPEAAFLASMMKVADNWVLDYKTYEELIPGNER